MTNYHREHYGKSKFEAIDVIEDWATTNQLTPAQAFAYGNLIKYLARINLKNQAGKDLDKARFYLHRLTMLMTNDSNNSTLQIQVSNKKTK